MSRSLFVSGLHSAPGAAVALGGTAPVSRNHMLVVVE